MEQTTTNSKTSLELARLKAASDEYKVHKSIYIDPVTEEQLEGFLEWPKFREQFLADWKSNRRVVTEKEADVHFDRIADESLSELEQIGSADVSTLAEQVAEQLPVDETAEAANEARAQAVERATDNGDGAPAPAVAPKRRGRPPGSGKKAAAVANAVVATEATATATPAKRKSYYVPVSQRKAATKTRKVAAKKKSGGNASEKAREVIAWGQSRKWSRKDIIERLMTRIGVGSAYASTLYQKFAK